MVVFFTEESLVAQGIKRVVHHQKVNGSIPGSIPHAEVSSLFTN